MTGYMQKCLMEIFGGIVEYLSPGFQVWRGLWQIVQLRGVVFSLMKALWAL